MCRASMQAATVGWLWPGRQLAEAVLRLLGVSAPEAARLAALPLPPTDTWYQPLVTSWWWSAVAAAALHAGGR